MYLTCFLIYCVGGTFEFRTVAANTTYKAAVFRKFENMTFSLKPNIATTATSAIGCSVQCLQMADCISVNYKQETGACDVNNGQKPSLEDGTLEASIGWRLYEKNPCGLGYQSGNHCHHVFFQQMKWTQARDFCQTIDGRLPEVFSVQEMDALVSDITEAGMDNNPWIWLGLNKTSMLWTSGAAANFTYWRTNSRPDTVPDSKECTLFRLNRLDNRWDVRRCNFKASFVCEKRNS